MPRVLTAVLLALALVLGGALVYRSNFTPLGGTVVETTPVVPDERLVLDDGRAARMSDVSDGTRLVFFGFTRCPDVCPGTLGVLARAYERLSDAERERLKVLLVTVDPEHDRPEVLRAYLKRFDPQFRGFTGDEAAVKRTLAGFYVYARRDGDDGNIAHGDTVAVVDSAGRMRRIYSQDDVAKGVLARDVRALARGRL
jgi:protein SCO1/2